MNCPRCGERMTTICIDFGGGYICRPCTLKQFAPPPSEQARAAILAAFDAGDEATRAALYAAVVNHERRAA